jgi:uncharacterized MAPEG superfamily protein
MTLQYGGPPRGDAFVAHDPASEVVTTQWRNCFHLRPEHDPDVNTMRKMGTLAIAERRYDTMWGVVNGGNALVHSVHRTKREADRERRDHACAYVVVRVVVTPCYTEDPRARAAALAFAQGRDIT